MSLIRLLVPANIRHSSGGNVYNARVAEGIRDLGVQVETVPVDGSWPDASARDRRRFGSVLGAWEQEQEHEPGQRSDVALVDGLVAVGAPDELEYATKAGRQTFVLVHMPVPETSGPEALQKEARALRAASGVICTSSSAAAVLKERGLPNARVALPGTVRAAPAKGSTPPHLLAVAALLPNKDQLLTVAALAGIQDLEWTASLVGSEQADPEYARLVREVVSTSGLAGRVHLSGELTGAALEAEWGRADLSLLVSREEAFGMVVIESLAHGVPAVVRQGTGAVEALGVARLQDADGGTRLPGAALDLPRGGEADAGVLGATLRRWLEDHATREEWKACAVDARERLPGWDITATTVLDVLAVTS
jgi:glycosyltransferase involved in cell wall biosynthesis